MGGKRKKIPMKKIEKKESRAVAFSKRRTGLYRKASKLCLLSGAQMAILTTPCSSNSHASFYSSVDGVVAAFLNDQHEDLAESEDPEELRGAIDSMSKLLKNLKELRDRVDSVNQRDHQDDVKNNNIKKEDLVLHETLNLQSTSAISDSLPIDHFNKIAKEQDQIMATGNLG
ncbi:PREDICTED: agamous-like MADS-box protein AGL97 [Camelina sativa]|uniref:Agamous-like MADS-box protein AGL97 n=1 Tax=Camelina sativa TaxID=90675 RepID=A0ABM0V6A9_CAMSA|nr:PREDICTED: agamous-like MADS-box protein AGL97 [Camelina sativa]